jgi:hypothetical protein
VPSVDLQVPSRARVEARRAANSAWLNGLARVGLAARGISYGLVGLLAAWLVFGEGGKATSPEGALATIADESLGKVLLILLAIGFAGYALWRLAQALFDKENEGEDVGGIAKRASYLARAGIYSVLAYVAVKLVLGAGDIESQNEKARKATAEVLGWPAGTWIVGIAGVFVIGVGLYNGYRGVTQSFLAKWNTGEMSAAERLWGARIGTVGLLARSLVFSLVGVFLLKAAFEYDPQEAVGLDGALQELRRQAYGSWLLAVVALGLLAYALYGVVAARYRRV